MKLFKGLQGLVLCTGFVVLAFGTAPAKAAISNTPFGSCVGSDTGGGAGSDCVTAVGHISASVVGTLTINEQRAISFGNMAVNCNAGAGPCTGDATISMDIFGTRVAASGGNDAFVLLHGQNATGGPAAAASGSQSPGHYTVQGGNENPATTTQVYISFADNAGNIIDTCSPNGSTGGVYGGTYAGAVGTCDQYHPGNAVTLTGPAGGFSFTVDHFTFNESGSDVYGHYIDNSGVGVGPGSTNPFLANRTNPNVASGVVDVVVGAELHTVAHAGLEYPVGKYTGTYDVMVSY